VGYRDRIGVDPIGKVRHVVVGTVRQLYLMTVGKELTLVDDF